MAEVRTETGGGWVGGGCGGEERGGEGLSLLQALGLRAAHTGYSITLHLLALLAFVISSLSPVWREDYKCDGLIQDTGGPIISIEPASPLGQALSALCPCRTSLGPTHRSSLAPGCPGSAAREGEWQTDGAQETRLQEQILEADSAHGGQTQRTAGQEDGMDRRCSARVRGRGLCCDLHASLEPEPAHAAMEAGVMGLFSLAAGAWQLTVDASPVSWHGRKCL